jgi:ribosomal protein S18 acetylase RimI-like enzyme
MMEKDFSNQNFLIKSIEKEDFKNNLSQFQKLSETIEMDYWQLDHYLHELPRKWDWSRKIINGKGEVIAFVIASEKADWIHVNRIVVDPSFQNQGLGKMLLDCIIEIGIKNQKKGVSLKTFKKNIKAEKWYWNVGFTTIDSSSEYHSLTLNF